MKLNKKDIDCLIGFEFHKFEKDEGCCDKRFFEDLLWFKAEQQDYLGDCPSLVREEENHYMILEDCIGCKINVVKEILDYDHESYMDDLVSVVQYVAEQNECWGHVINDGTWAIGNFKKLHKLMLNAFKVNDAEKVSIITAWGFNGGHFIENPERDWIDHECVLLGQVNMDSIEILGE